MDIYYLPRDWCRREPFADVGRGSFWATTQTEAPIEKRTNPQQIGSNKN